MLNIYVNKKVCTNSCRRSLMDLTLELCGKLGSVKKAK